MAGIDRPIVVGGGAAGLAACRTLEAAGHAPILLRPGTTCGRLAWSAWPTGRLWIGVFRCC